MQSQRLTFFVGSQPHFVNCLAPIYLALPEHLRGPFIARANAEKRAKEFGITPTKLLPRFNRDSIVVVCGHQEYKQTNPARVIYFTYGVGQTYLDAPQSPYYSGGDGRDRAVLFLGPSERDAARNRERYPGVPAVAVGVPYLDSITRKDVPSDPPVVAISFHCDVRIVPETRYAWPYYRKAIVDLARNPDFQLLGHAHPRNAHQLKPWWRKIGVPFEENWLKVIEQCDVYCVDNSSTLYEAAAVGIPVVALNHPGYRRDVEHGLRFWSNVPGWQVDTPEQLEPHIKLALMDTPTTQLVRQSGVAAAYGDLIDGHATERAVVAINEIMIATAQSR